ncbi:hypothetical protein D3C81_525300 [compost metagenome]
MPNIVVELPETYNSQTRPAIVQVAKQLIDIMRLPADTGFEFFGTPEAQFQPQSTVTDNGIQNKFPFTGRVNIEADEEYLEDRTLTTAVKRPNVQFIFYDQKLDVYVKPIYVLCEVKITFRYRAPDRTQAERWRDEFRVRSSQGRAEILHALDYHYPVPDVVALMLHEIYTMREAVAGYGDTLEEWVKNHITGRATALTTLAGTQALMAIAERQVGIVGGFDFVAQPEKGQKAGEGAPWECGFDYTFQYDKVVGIAYHHPVAIHNQLIDPKFRPAKPVYELANQARRPSDDRFGYDYFTNLYKQQAQPLAGNRIPVFDDWLPTMVPPRTSSMLDILIGVGDDPRELVNVNELGDFEFSDATLRFLRKEWPYINKLFHSIFHFALYRWDKPMEDGTVVMDADGNLRSTIDLDPRNLYHLRLTMVNDLRFLTKDAIDRIRKDGEFCIEVIETLYPKKKPLPPLVGGIVFPGDWLQDLINKSRIDQTRRMFTVGTTAIIAKRKITRADS